MDGLEQWLKTFTKQERTAAKCGQVYYCQICGCEMFYCDIMNLDDIMPMSRVCPTCKRIHQEGFFKKRDQLRRKSKQ